MTEFTPFSALIGGAFIGLSTLLLWLLDGQIAGISGILGRLITAQSDTRLWRAAFILGLVLAPTAYVLFHRLPPFEITHQTALVILAGLCVGFGTRLGSGCTSGHGVCGVARLSKRSLVATFTFIVVGAVTVLVTRHVLILAVGG